jgi:hypothetical protein
MTCLAPSVATSAQSLPQRKRGQVSGLFGWIPALYWRGDKFRGSS